MKEAGDTPGNRPGDYGVPDAYFDRFDEQMEEYRRALVLYVLLAKAQHDVGYEALLQAYEATILPPEPTPEGEAHMLKLREIMKALDFVLRPHENPPLSWSIAWFADIGLDLHNPNTALEFLTHWMDSFLTVRKEIDQITHF